MEIERDIYLRKLIAKKKSPRFYPRGFPCYFKANF